MNKSRPRLSLLAQFSLLSFITLIVIAVTLGYLLQQKITESELEQEAANAIEQAQWIIAPKLTAADLDGLAPTQLELLNAEIRDHVINRRIFRVKIWNTQGKLIYSDERELIGQMFPPSDELRQAFAGNTAMRVSSLDRPENIAERAHVARAFEIYAPIIPRDRAATVGAYEIYARLDAAQARIATIEQTLFAGLALGFLALYIALFAIVRGASRELIRHQTDNEQLYALEQRRARDFQTINDVGRQLTAILAPTELTAQVLRAITERFGYDRAALYMVHDHQITATILRGYPTAVAEHTRRAPRQSLTTHPLIAQAIAARKTIVIADVRIDSRGAQHSADDPTLSQVALPLNTQGKLLGALVISSYRANAFEQSDVLLLESLAAQIAIALDNAQMHEATQQRLRQLRALRTIDQTISATLELARTLDVLLDQALAHVGPRDAAGWVALRDADDPTQLRVEAAKNLSAELAQTLSQQIHASILARVMEDGIPRVVADMAHDARTRGCVAGAQENLRALVAAPMRVAGEQIGALVVCARQPYSPNDEELNFFVTLGGQAALVVQNTRRYEDAQRQAASLADLARQLEESYTATLTAMSTALDVRDHETEGHAQRVAELACWLARASGMTDEHELRAIHYGALLHDIGKIQISDAVLGKPETLSDAERIEIRRHAEIGATILRGIPFLRNALPVVASHHERWNGAGYPEGLAGKAIPLVARIFAIIDVYDALMSARPYREAWSEEQAREFVRAHSGTWFDPRLVQIFLEMLKA
ncbi:MAG: GAF domain-containing protein [Chloroflexi bacterium]|nr:GAF domain-containing protein [Chloroflexota bacterium]